MTTGIKYDDGKPRTDLLPPSALLEVARVLGHGVEKYSDYNWQHVEDPSRRYTAAALRHILAYMRGETWDRDSGLHHLSHAICSLMFVVELGCGFGEEE